VLFVCYLFVCVVAVVEHNCRDTVLSNLYHCTALFCVWFFVFDQLGPIAKAFMQLSLKFGYQPLLEKG
jgi:hypothetical protein